MRMVVALALVASLAYGVVSCKSTGPGRVEVKKEAAPDSASDIRSVTLGWIDGDTFRVRSEALYQKQSGERDLRRADSKRLAVQQAQESVIEKFVRDRVKHASKVLDPRSTGVAITNEFGGIVRKGEVTREKYNERDACEIIYEVKSPDLKKRVFGISR